MREERPFLVLASGSPRRRQVLEQLGVAFRVVPAPEGVETPWDGVEAPRAFAERLARVKADAVSGACPGAIVLAADTIVDLDGAVLEKPRDEAHAREMLGRLAGREHVVHTGAAVAVEEGRTVSGVESTGVRFRALDARQIEAYVATGEPLDKAGAYGIQGYGAALVESVHGCYFNVMGFPVSRVLGLLEQAGWRYAFPESRAE